MAGVAERLASGTKLGPYEVRAFLGAGGMGAVYRAFDARLGRDVAVKVLPDAARGDPTWIARFEREARAAAAISHPNVMALHDVGVHDGAPYIVCELLEGETLKAKLERGPLPLARALDWARQIARGLGAAQERGLVHRDLKPANLFVARDGTVKILDFGLAKGGPPAAGTDDTAPVTETGAVLGTLGYMAPEQVVGKPADHRADLFAFGVVLYEMLAGKRPFDGDSGPEIARTILTQEPPPLDAPAPVARLVAHALAKEPAERFQSARDLLFALDGLDATAATPPGRRPPRWAALLVALVPLAGAGGWLLARRPAVPAASEPAAFQHLSNSRSYIGNARFLGDGSTFVFDSWVRDKPARIMLGRLGKLDATQVQSGAYLVAVSRNDELLVLRAIRRLHYPISEGTLARVDVAGGAPRDVAEHVTSADWSPDGREIALVRDEAGRQRLEYLGKTLYASERGIGEIRVAPDGQRIAFVDFVEPGNDQGFVGVVDLAGSVRRLTAEYATVRHVAWSADGRELTYSAGTAGAREVHAVTLDGVDRAVLRGPDTLDIKEVARDGRLLVVRDSTQIFHFAHVDGVAGAKQITTSDYEVHQELSADGRFLALHVEGEVAGEPRAYLKPIDGGPATLLGEGSEPKLSPDGKWVVVSSILDRARLTLLPVGPGAARTLPAGKVTERWGPRFAGPDRVLFVGLEPGVRSRVYVQELPGGDPRPISPEGFDLLYRGSQVSPDGQSVLARDPSGQVVVMALADGAARPVPGLGANDGPIGWTEDGKGLYIYVWGETESIDLLDPATGQRKLWRDLGVGGIGGEPARWSTPPIISRNGKVYVSRFVVGQSDLYLVTPPGR